MVHLTIIGLLSALTVSLSGSPSSPDTLQNISSIANIIYAGLTVAIVIVAIWSLAFTRNQMNENKTQFEATLKASAKQSQDAIDAVNKQIAASEAQFQQERYIEHLPLLIPEGAPNFKSVKSLFLNKTTNEQRISIHNVGPGVALNVASVLFSESYNTVSDDAIKYIHWTCWLGVPVAAGLVMKADHKLNRGLYDVNTMHIGSYTLNASEPDPNFLLPNTLARITFTCLDIFRRKHASIFDYVEDGWQLVEFLEDIPQDLHDLQFEVFNG